jgi:hypothetical protein
MLTTQQVVNRRSTYACCALDYLHKYTVANTYGDAKCAKESWEKAVYMKWAADMMCQTPVLDGEDGCNSIEFATKVADKADCYCKQCGCEPVSPTLPPVPNDCTITPDYTVLDTVDVDERLVIEADTPTVGDSYYVVTDSGGSGWTVNTIVTWNGGGWDEVTVLQGQVVFSSGTNLYWTPGANDEPGPLFPTLTGFLVSFDNQYVIQSAAPQIAIQSTRTVLVRGYVNGVWQIIFSGPETALAVPTTYDFNTLPITALQVVYFVSNGCSYTAGATVVPPFGECGTINAVITPVSDCSQSEFSVNVDIQDVSGYPLGSLIHSINGVLQPAEPAVLGTTVLGPFDTGDVVTIRITNAQDSECDFDAGSYTDPSYPISDRTVTAAVDVSFEGSQVLGDSYLVVSNTGNITNAWSPYVGQFFNGAIFIPLNDGEIVESAAVPGFDRYWQRVNNVTVQMYPPIILQNVQSFPYPWQVVSANPTSAATRFRPTVIEAMFDGDWLPIWVGLEADLATGQQVDFTSIGLVEPQEVRVTYFGTACPITIESTIVSDPVELEFECGGPEQILGSGDLYDIYYDWNDGLYLITSDDDDLINSGDPVFADLAIGDIIDVDATYVSTPPPGTVLYLSNGGGAYYIVGTQPGEIILSPYQGVGQVYMFTQQPSSLQTWTFTSDDPAGTVTIEFIQGTMDANNVIRVFDGTNDSGTSLGSGNFPDLSNNMYTSLSPSIYMEAESDSDPTDTQTPWIFIVKCTSGFVQPSASALPSDNCVDYNFSIDIDIFDVGDSAGGVVNIQYVVDGVVTTVAGVGTGITTIGPFDYDDTVQVYIRNLTDPSADLWLGLFQSGGSCSVPPNPCLPDSTFKVDIVGDLSELPTPPPNPMISEVFYVLSDNTNIGTFEVASILAWDIMSQSWGLLFVAPDGSFIYGPMTVVAGTIEQATIFGNGPGGPYLAFAPILVGINPDVTGITDNFRIKIDVVENGQVTTDRPVKLQVFSDGAWVDVWFGTEQMLNQWTPIGVTIPFTLTRSVYNYDTCAVEAAYIIDIQQGLQTP